MENKLTENSSLTQYPEHAEIPASLSAFSNTISSALSSNNESAKEYYSIEAAEMKNISDSINKTFDFGQQAVSDYDKLLADPNISPEERDKIRASRDETFKKALEHDSELHEFGKATAERTNNKDSEIRDSNRRLAINISVCVVVALLVGVGAFEAKSYFALPKKN